MGSVTDGGNGIKNSDPEAIITSWDRSYKKADTLEELIDILYDGYSDKAKKTALESIAKYTEYAKNGYDEEFQVNPKVLHPIENGPFYGSKTTGATFLAVFGGLRTNDECQVCEEDDTPIEGLYNVGTMIGDFYSNSYNFVLPGQNLGACCCTLPYLVGKKLAGDNSVTISRSHETVRKPVRDPSWTRAGFLLSLFFNIKYTYLFLTCRTMTKICPLHTRLGTNACHQCLTLGFFSKASSCQ
ncbi:MAG: FAD-binding protein [Lachnospiraceae bacterium]|nr:FAD-binding protein [Lachnospiraceae bacterium]